MTASTDVQARIWLTWTQECKWACRPCGFKAKNTATLDKLAGVYDCDAGEEFIRAQFATKQPHGFAFSGPILFKHLAGDQCREVYEDYLKSQEDYANMRSLQVRNIVSYWYDARTALIDGEPVTFQTDDSLAKCIIRYLSRTLADGDKHLHVAAIECIHWPKIIDKLKIPMNLMSQITAYRNQVN